ncbi:efflux RND transporter periplasmic adaptor subunit [Moorellaceae bacterium AZ2]
MQEERETLAVRLGRKIRRFKWPLILLVLLVGMGGYFGYRHLKGSAKPAYLSVPVGKVTIQNVVQATGTLEPVRTASLNFKSAGLIKAVYVKVGDRVKKGQLLAEQDTQELEGELRKAESSLKKSEVELKNLLSGPKEEEIAQKQSEVEVNRLEYEAAQKDLERQKKLYEAGAASAADVESAEKAVVNAKAKLQQSELALKLLQEGSSQEEIAAAQAAVEATRIDVEMAQLNLEGAKITAPFDGIVTEVNGEVGQRAGGTGNGGETGGVITLVSEELQLKALVNEADIGKVQEGQDVEFTVSAYGTTTFKGKVASIAPQASTQSNVAVFEVVISVEDPNHQLKSGMTATANIILARKEDTLAVPAMAISYAESYLKANAGRAGAGAQPGSAPSAQGGQVREGQEGKGKQSMAATAQSEDTRVVLVLQNGEPLPRRIKVGLSDGEYTEVLEGLSEGERVVIGVINARSSSSTTRTQQGSSSSNNQRSVNQRTPGMPGGPMPPGPPL